MLKAAIKMHSYAGATRGSILHLVEATSMPTLPRIPRSLRRHCKNMIAIPSMDDDLVSSRLGLRGLGYRV